MLLAEIEGLQSARGNLLFVLLFLVLSLRLYDYSPFSGLSYVLSHVHSGRLLDSGATMGSGASSSVPWMIWTFGSAWVCEPTTLQKKSIYCLEFKDVKGSGWFWSLPLLHSS